MDGGHNGDFVLSRPEEVTLMDGTKRVAVITRGDGESDEAFEARIVETDAIIAGRN